MSSDWQYLKLSRADRVLTVRFDSGHKVNSLNNALMRELTQLAIQLQEDSELNAIVLCGRDNIFSAGMDLKDPESSNAKNLSVAQRSKLLQVGPKPTPTTELCARKWNSTRWSPS